MKKVTFKKTAIAASIGVVMGSAVSVAQADAILFPVVQSGNGMATYLHLANTAPIGVVGATGAINSTASAAYGEDMRFVFNYGTALTVAANGNVTNNACSHIDLPAGMSDKDVMLIEATTGTGSTATQLLPVSGSGYAAEKSFAPRVTGPMYGSIAISNAWAAYMPVTVAAPNTAATGVWAGSGTNTPNEGSLFGQAWMVDTVNGTMVGYNALNDPNEATTTATYNTAAQASFSTNMPDQYLLAIAPNFGGTVNTRYWMFPTNSTTTYTSTLAAPAAVTVNIGASAGNDNNTYNSVSTADTGFWDHNEGWISAGVTAVTVPCGGINMPVSNMMSAAHWSIAQYTGALMFADVPRGTATESSGSFTAGARNAALVYKQLSVAGGHVIAMVTEPGIITSAGTATSAALANAKNKTGMTAARSYTK